MWTSRTCLELIPRNQEAKDSGAPYIVFAASEALVTSCVGFLFHSRNLEKNPNFLLWYIFYCRFGSYLGLSKHVQPIHITENAQVGFRNFLLLYFYI